MAVGVTDAPWACAGRNARQRKTLRTEALATNDGLILRIANRINPNAEPKHATIEMLDDSTVGALRENCAVASESSRDEVHRSVGSWVAGVSIWILLVRHRIGIVRATLTNEILGRIGSRTEQRLRSRTINAEKPTQLEEHGSR